MMETMSSLPVYDAVLESALDPSLASTPTVEQSNESTPDAEGMTHTWNRTMEYQYILYDESVYSKLTLMEPFVDSPTNFPLIHPIRFIQPNPSHLI